MSQKAYDELMKEKSKLLAREYAKTDPRVIAVRADKLIGSGTCSSIDECMEPHELVERCDYLQISDPIEAAKYFRKQELVWLEQGMNASSGEADCPLVKAYKDFMKAMADNPL